MERLRGDFGLERVVLVGDRGMLADARIEDLRRHPGLGWISALRHHAIRRLAEDGAFQPSLFDERGLAEIASDAYPGERLVVCRNPLLAERRRAKREELLAATEAGFERIAKEVARRTRKPLPATDIAEKAARVKSRFKVGKHFDADIADGAFSWRRQDLDADIAERDPVAAATTGDAARRKKARGTTPDGLPLHSFSTLLDHLATRCRNRCRAKAVPDSPAFHSDTEPTPLQRRALELVKTFPVDFAR